MSSVSLNKNRGCGVLMHITSLPSPYGIGTMGKSARDFVDKLKSAGQGFWQVLPTNPIGYGNSPYQSYCTFAGEPLLIDLDELVDIGLLNRERCNEADFGADETFVDFDKVIRVKKTLLKEAFESFSEDVSYLAFINEEDEWLDDYAIFMAIKEANNNAPFTKWGKALRLRDERALERFIDENRRLILFHKFTQYLFFKQWGELKQYANKNGIKLIGDIPIYVSPDSCDVWTRPDLFMVDEDLIPLKVAGVPPDYFSKTGQLWGNPLYNWKAMEEEGFSWWINRIRKTKNLYDCVRIDHFRAFDTYYAINYGEKTAVKGEWLKAPGIKLFDKIKSDTLLKDTPIIAEDLGDLFESVRVLLKHTRFPGMKVLLFGFNSENKDNEHLPHNYFENMVAYTGTHDNSTINGFLKANTPKTTRMAKGYLAPRLFEPINWAAIRALYASSANLVIVPMQDLLGLGDKARMNTPGTVSDKNWSFRMKKDDFDEKTIKRLRLLEETYFR